MPRYCRFDDDVMFHRSLASISHEPRAIGVRLTDSNIHTLKRNVAGITFNVQEYVERYGTSGSGFIWCTQEEYEYNWTYLASEVLRRCLRIYPGGEGYSVALAKDMPKFSVGITKSLDVVARDESGRWLYLEKTGDTIESVVSDVPPECAVVYSPGNNDMGRCISADKYWVTIRSGKYVIIRPPLNCPDDIVVPYGAFLNSRFVFHGDDSYLFEPSPAACVFLIGNSELTTYQVPSCGVYGQLVLHEDDDKMYMTLTPVYPDIFGCRITRKYNDVSKSVFQTTSYEFCGNLSCQYNFNTRNDRYVDCLSGDTLNIGDSPDMCYGMPTRGETFNKHFVVENGFVHSVWRRMMSVDDDGNKVYKSVDTNDFVTNLLLNFGSLLGHTLSYEGENYRWDYRNAAWIREEDAIYISPTIRRNSLDVFTHCRFVTYTTCSLCHAKTIYTERTDRYKFIYFIDGKRYNKSLCDSCLYTIFHGDTLDIPIEDGSVLHVSEDGLISCNEGYTLSKWWILDAEEGGGEGFIDERAIWDNERQEWELENDNDGALRLTLTSEGYVISERYCTHVNGYFYKPSPIFFKDNNEDTQKFFGIELEVMDGGESSLNAKRVCHSHEELYAKHDGSLDDGMELVSHPCTVSWHLTHLWDDVLSKLHTLHYHARNGSGIHVHVSKKYWENNGGLCRITNLITFCDINREALRLYANRERGAFDHWTHEYMSPSNTKKVVVNALTKFGDTEEAMRDLYDKYSSVTNHYSVVNLSNESTVEIRAFASTLDINRMHSIVQFVDVLTELSTEATLGNPITFQLIQTRAQSKGYTELSHDPKFIMAIDESNRYVDTRVCS